MLSAASVSTYRQSYQTTEAASIKNASLVTSEDYASVALFLKTILDIKSEILLADLMTKVWQINFISDSDNAKNSVEDLNNLLVSNNINKFEFGLSSTMKRGLTHHVVSFQQLGANEADDETLIVFLPNTKPELLQSAVQLLGQKNEEQDKRQLEELSKQRRVVAREIKENEAVKRQALMKETELKKTKQDLEQKIKRFDKNKVAMSASVQKFNEGTAATFITPPQSSDDSPPLNSLPLSEASTSSMTLAYSSTPIISPSDRALSVNSAPKRHLQHQRGLCVKGLWGSTYKSVRLPVCAKSVPRAVLQTQAKAEVNLERNNITYYSPKNFPKEQQLPLPPPLIDMTPPMHQTPIIKSALYPCAGSQRTSDAVEVTHLTTKRQRLENQRIKKLYKIPLPVQTQIKKEIQNTWTNPSVDLNFKGKPLYLWSSSPQPPPEILSSSLSSSALAMSPMQGNQAVEDNAEYIRTPELPCNPLELLAVVAESQNPMFTTLHPKSLTSNQFSECTSISEGETDTDTDSDTGSLPQSGGLSGLLVVAKRNKPHTLEPEPRSVASKRNDLVANRGHISGKKIESKRSDPKITGLPKTKKSKVAVRSNSAHVTSSNKELLHSGSAALANKLFNELTEEQRSQIKGWIIERADKETFTISTEGKEQIKSRIYVAFNRQYKTAVFNNISNGILREYKLSLLTERLPK
ncbi:hypothetical protein D5R81_02825 [Parashewanella spongiae]|uniref:Uncharacterized protein n=1 Tax=Parashewanella spongiae TaxID=342950 RepID=A0A3A6UIR6_9GAMM|nr:hypothetical protein [Parashewanella spongiae]MCL1077391.1 hypothetical protein [Parashewanella spongiae]RJY18983.1 hypothetical protein D5R81_02825 [Parashewanella spongiae]